MAVGFHDLARALAELSYLRAAMFSFDGEFGEDALRASSGAIRVDSHGEAGERLRGPRLLSADGSVGDVRAFARHLSDTALRHRGITPELLSQVSDFARELAEAGPGGWARSVTMARLLSEAHVRVREEGADVGAISLALERARAELGVTTEDMARLEAATADSPRPLSSVVSGLSGVEPAEDAFAPALVGTETVELWTGGATDADGARVDLDFFPDPPRGFASLAVEVADAMEVCAAADGVRAARGVAADARADLSCGESVSVYGDYDDAERALAARLAELRFEAAQDGVSDSAFASCIAMGHAGWLYRRSSEISGASVAKRRACRMALAVALVASGDVDLDDAMAEVAEGAVSSGLAYDPDVFVRVSQGLAPVVRRAVSCGASPGDVAASLEALSASVGNPVATDPVLSAAGVLDAEGRIRPSDRIRVIPGSGEVLPELIAEASNGI